MLAAILGGAVAACGGDDEGGKRPGADAGEAGSGGAAGSNPDASVGDGGSGGTGGTGGSVTGGVAGTGGQGGSATGGSSAIPDAGFDAYAPIVSLSKVDLLLVVDNSISMTDKAELLRQAVPDLITELVDPASGIEDLHVGVITSSLGAFGGNACQDTDEQENDRAHLVGSLPRASTLGLTSGFVTWDASVDLPTFTNQIEELITLAGDQGCGFESTLEAMYRFMADPNPPLQVVTGPCSETNSNPCASTTGTDDVLLAQWAAFFRPDSLVAVVVLTDENDCSMRPEGQFYYAARSDVTMPRGSSVCATNPNDPCCYSCISAVPAGCEPDPICATDPYLSYAEDELNLRCFEQQRRFGFTSLYPIERYINALTKPRLCTTKPDLDTTDCPTTGTDGGVSGIADNPLYVGQSTTGITRTSSMVQLLGIVGVPWQNVAATVGVDGQPLPPEELRFQTAADLDTAGLWPVILGDPRSSPPALPTEPLMNESITPRSGMTSTTLEPIAPPTGGYLENSINGHEWIPAGDDLQYACIYPLATPRDCVPLDYTSTGCDCKPSSFDPLSYNPLCQAANGTYGNIQYAAKAYPSLRHLDLLRGLGPNAVVASICARNVTDTAAVDFGFRPAITSALEQWKARLIMP